jgi:glycosyltransferase involved in cell wall biosynthesis
LISIIIPTYNDNDSLKLCLKSIAASDHKPLEVIVVDDGSAQPAGDIVAEYGYRYIRLDRNSGQATARNEGARVAQGDILFFIDSDVAVRKESIGTVAEAHGRDGVSVFQGIPSKTPLNSGFGPELLSSKMYYMLKDCRQASYIHSHIFSIKRHVFEAVGGFDTSFKPPGCGEEFDLGHRLREKFIIHTDPELVADQKGTSVLLRARVLYFRAYSWAGLFSNVHRFEKTNASFSEALLGGCSVAAAVCLLCSVLSPLFLYAAILFFVSHLLLGMGFYRFLVREKGVVFMLRAIAPNMLWAMAAVTGGLRYFIDGFVGWRHESR